MYGMIEDIRRAEVKEDSNSKCGILDTAAWGMMSDSTDIPRGEECRKNTDSRKVGGFGDKMMCLNYYCTKYKCVVFCIFSTASYSDCEQRTE